MDVREGPNVEVNRRAEGTSELNRRLGAVGKGTGALEGCGVAGDYGRGCAGKQARCVPGGGQTGEQQASNQATLPERKGGGAPNVYTIVRDATVRHHPCVTSSSQASCFPER